MAVFKNTDTGYLEERPYGHFYSLMPTTTHSILADAGLADSTGYLDVDPFTLQHTKYDNIFGLGDVINAPTTKSFYGGLSQVAVLRHNIERKLNGLSLNAKYDGYSKTAFYGSRQSILSFEHKYSEEEVKSRNDPISALLRYKLYSMTGKHNHENILKFKNWGPPYYKFKKSFTAEESSTTTEEPAKSAP